MKITSIIENTTAVGLPVEHGLSLYIGLDSGGKILFDMGQSRLFADNAEQLGLSIPDVDMAVISHGHYDHGGGLRTFLSLNHTAKVYIHGDAFQPHYSLRSTGLTYIGLDKELKDCGQLVWCGSLTHINDSLTLFADVNGKCCWPAGNRLLFGPDQRKNDLFTHEQNLIIAEGEKVVLLAGCAHNGIVNIVRKAAEIYGKPPTHVFGGMHLVKSGLNIAEENCFIASLACEMQKFTSTRFFTMHCTGTDQFRKLKTIMGNQIEYFSCGETAEI